VKIGFNAEIAEIAEEEPLFLSAFSAISALKK